MDTREVFEANVFDNAGIASVAILSSTEAK